MPQPRITSAEAQNTMQQACLLIDFHLFAVYGGVLKTEHLCGLVIRSQLNYHNQITGPSGYQNFHCKSPVILLHKKGTSN